MDDRYCYPGTDTLKNKFNLRDAARLADAEAVSTAIRLYELQRQPLGGRFDLRHLRAIHKYIFQDVYSWAGSLRTVNIGKGNLFCLVQNLESFARTVFPEFQRAAEAAGRGKDEFVPLFSAAYGDLNALHPFREGNGRAQREFAREFCMQCGYVFDMTRTSHAQMLDASIKSFSSGDNSGFNAVFSECIIPAAEYIGLPEKLESVLLTLSCDD